MTSMPTQKPVAGTTSSLREQVRQLMLARKYVESLPYHAKLARALKEKDALFYLNYAYALVNSGRFEEALPILDEAIGNYPAHAEFFVCRGNAHHMLGAFDPMLADYRQALRLEPSNGKVRYALGIREMMTSGLTEGFANYAFRTHSDLAPKPPVSLPRWRGEELDGKRLFIYGEQGVGDIIMWAGLLPVLFSSPLEGERASAASRGGSSPPRFELRPSDSLSAAPPQGGSYLNVGLAVPAKMLALFKRSFPQIEMFALEAKMDDAVAGRYDIAVPMGDLMSFLLRDATPSAHAPYLKPDAGRTQMLRQQYLNLSGMTGLHRLVGIAWHTSNAMSQLVRTISLDQWAPVFEVPGVQFVSLQYGDHTQEIAELNQRYPGLLFSDPDVNGFQDMDALAVQIAAMDEVITIQNATAHLAGALNTPTTLLLSSASDWRWGIQREDSIWYKSVNIIRQKRPFDWKMPMLNAAHALHRRAGT